MEEIKMENTLVQDLLRTMDDIMGIRKDKSLLLRNTKKQMEMNLFHKIHILLKGAFYWGENARTLDGNINIRDLRIQRQGDRI